MPLAIGIGLSLSNFPLNRSGVAGPAAPTGLAATPGDQEVALAWDDEVGVTWKVYRSLTDDFGSSSELDSGLTDPAYTDTTGTPGTKYFYWVTATNGGDSSPSDSVAGRAFIVIPGGQSAVVTFPPGTWTLGTVFFASTLIDLVEITTPVGSTNYVYFGGDWFNSGNFDPANNVSVSGTGTFINPTGSPATLWDGEPP